MSNSYSIEYGYPSLIYPARMFKTREDAQSFDALESRSALLDSSFTRAHIEAIANGTVPEEAAENCRVILAALRWTVNAAEDAESAKRLEEWSKKKEDAQSDAAKIAVE